MNNEIKEILSDMFHIICKYGDDFDDLEENEIRYQLPYTKMEKLYDYITNLQEENENLKDFNNKLQATKDRLDKYDRENQLKIDKANRILQEILVVSDWEHEGRYRPVKNTTAQDVYKTIIKLNELLETPSRQNYGLLQGEDKGE